MRRNGPEPEMVVSSKTEVLLNHGAETLARPCTSPIIWGGRPSSLVLRTLWSRCIYRLKRFFDVVGCGEGVVYVQEMAFVLEELGGKKSSIVGD